MTRDEVLAICLSLPGAEETYPFGWRARVAVRSTSPRGRPAIATILANRLGTRCHAARGGQQILVACHQLHGRQGTQNGQRSSPLRALSPHAAVESGETRYPPHPPTTGEKVTGHGTALTTSRPGDHDDAIVAGHVQHLTWVGRAEVCRGYPHQSTRARSPRHSGRKERFQGPEPATWPPSGDAALGVVVPHGFTAAVQGGKPVTVDLVEGDGAGLETDVLLSVVRAVLDELAVGAQPAAAGARAGVPHHELATLAQRAATQAPAVTLTQGRAASEQLSMSGALVAGQAGLFLLFTVGFGVLGLVAEREQGTLARLGSMPMRPGLVVAAKGLVGYLLGVVATTVLLTTGSVLFDVSFGSPLVVAVLVLSAVAAATSLMLVIARLARTAEQAGIAQTILAIVLGMAGGAFFPITAPGLLGWLLDLNPVAAFTRGLGISSGGGGPADVAVPVATLLGFAVVAVTVSRLVPDRGREL